MLALISVDAIINKTISRAMLLLLVGVLSACAQKLPDEARIPLFSGKPVGDITVATVDYRSFILNGDKEPWFEGISRGGFGIPFSLQRSDVPENQSFAVLISKLIEESLEKAGSKVNVVEVAAGTDRKKVIEILSQSRQTSLLVEMNRSRYECCYSQEYRHDFILTVLDSTGNIIAQKRFEGWDKDLSLEAFKYNVVDSFSEVYAQKLKAFLHEPNIKAALEGVAP